MAKALILLLFVGLAFVVEAIGVKTVMDYYGYASLAVVYLFLARSCIKQIRTNHGW